GAGNVGKFYLKENPEALLINCDISTPLLKLAKKRFGKNASYIRSDNRFFPLKEGSVDVLFSSFCVRNSPNPELTVSEAFRVLKPGAVWAILDFFKLDDRSICSAANNLIFRSFMKVNSIVNREAIEYLFESIERFYTVKEFKGLLEDSGFEVTEVKRFMGGVANTVIAVRREV
ncbi:MAG: class I SAM-dependent methyltransferase, partial [Desulfurobacteriaceae bacterium]